MKPPRFRPAPGRTAFVVGASAGIGLAASRQLAAAGCSVALFARRPETLERAAETVRAANPEREARVWTHPLDAADAEATRSAFDLARSELGAPDLVLGCAGRARPAYFEAISLEGLDETLHDNLRTAWNTAQAGARAMEGRPGTLVLTSSLAGLVGVFGYTDYCASKFAVMGLAESLLQELAPRGIQVAVLCPPDTDTPGFEVENRDKPPETRAVSEGASLLGPDDVATALWHGLARGRFQIVPGRSAGLLALAARHLPGLARRVQASQVRAAQKKS